MKRKLLWLALRAVPEEADGEEITDTGTVESTLDDIIDDDDAGAAPAGGAPEETPDLKVISKKQRQLEADLAAERAARIAAEERARSAAPRPEPTRDPEYDAEERELAQAKANGANADALAWLQWKVDQTRSIRATKRNSDEALSITKDAADRSDFARLEFTKPALFKRYGDRVEKAAAEWRAKGQLVPREAILRLLIGDDMVKGELKTKTKPAPTTTAAPATQRLERTLPARGRSDVDRKRVASEKEARYERLKDRYI